MKDNPSANSIAKEDAGEPALNAAAREGRLDDALAMARAGADVNAVDPKGRVALMAAMQPFDAQARLALVQELLALGADPNAKALGGGTVAMFAAMSGAAECLRELGRAGADLNATTDAGASAATIAAGGEHWEALAYLATQGALGGVSREGKGVEAIVRDRIAQGADIDPQDWAPLERAWLERQTSKAAQGAPPRL